MNDRGPFVAGITLDLSTRADRKNGNNFNGHLFLGNRKGNGGSSVKGIGWSRGRTGSAISGQQETLPAVSGRAYGRPH